MKTIQKITPSIPALPKLKQVAAYCRVSSGKDAMLNSLSAQVSYYSDFIQKHHDWQYAGVYVDEAVSGTKDGREQFQRLIDDCRNGKIDLILTKSISRFARNTVIVLETVRELKTMNVDVYFERENIHSMSGDGELMLSILASFAQEESLSTSENQKWRIRKNFKEGRLTSTTMLGFTLIDGTLHIVPEEAEIVRMIFKDYLSGMGKGAIMKKLMAMGVATKRGGNWSESVIHQMLRNEKYAGDALLQKSFVADHISKRKCINRGELPMYHVENAHEAIIDRETFDAVQMEIERRAATFKSAMKKAKEYLYTGKITCAICGKHYRRKIANSGTKYQKAIWMCSTFNRFGKAVCPSQQIPESILFSLIGEDFIEIRVPCPGTLIVLRTDGTEGMIYWENHSRSDSWTAEMKEVARQKALEGGKAKCKQQQRK